MENKEEWVKDKSIKLYEYFYAAVINSTGLKFRPTKRQEKMFENFVKRIKKSKKLHSVGRDYLIIYFQFQFKYWYGLDTMFDGKVMPEWVVGKKAWDRWLNRDSKFDFTVQPHIHLEKVRIVTSELNDLFSQSKVDISKVNRAEEEERKRFLNDTKGLAWCLQETSLFYHRSTSCQKCKSRIECKELLKVKYSKIYRLRGYE